MSPLFPVTFSGGNDADISPAFGIDDGEGPAFEFAPDKDSFFTATRPARDFDRRFVPDSLCILEGDAVFFDVRCVFVFIPLKLH